ncbi:glycosyltransferase family 4 protein [Aestuariirhabdus sp. LZHN29]|uniref:glycosyltransferase family 4 protein n=1 Tax=Aestuariirhabdus sp. LZHN29 TaxID=3417462 RepID=UPI003CEAF08E
MRVLHFYKTYYPDTVGGVEQVINQIIRGCARQGVESEVLTLSSSMVDRTVEVDGHLVHRCRSHLDVASTPFSVSALWRFRQRVKQADIVHYHYPYPFTDLLHLLSGINKPTVVTYHSDIVKQKNLLKIYRPLKRRFLSSVDRIVATSPNYLRNSSVLNRYNGKVISIPIGLDKGGYPVPVDAKVSRWSERFGCRFFLFVGLLRYYKGLHILIEAAKDAPYPIVIVGAGPIEQELKQQVRAQGVTNIHFVGRVSEADKVALLSLAHGIVFPSHLRSEAFGVSLLEGAMYGKPLISSEIGTGTTYINIDGETGLVVPPSDPVALRGAMDRLWNDTELAANMGEKAYQRYTELFTADRMASSYVELYRSLLDERGR